MEDLVSWVQENFKTVALVLVGLVVARWLWHRLAHGLEARRHRTHARGYCKHCNWEGWIPRRSPRCSKCGSQDVKLLS